MPGKIITGMSTTDTSEKTVDLVNSPEVQIMKEGEKDFIDIDFKNLEKGKFYRVEYEGDVYGVEKQDDGKIAYYEVVE
jgi:hypothetical protein